MLATGETIVMGSAAGFVPVKDTRPLGAVIDELFNLREEYRALDVELKDKKKVFARKEEALIERLQQEGVDGARGATASVSLAPSIVPNVENWDEFYRYIHRNKAYHLLERRPAAGAYRELMTQRMKPVPGVVPFEKLALSMRTV